MGNTVVVNKGDFIEEFKDVLGHQVGNGCVQVLSRDGNQRIIFAPDDITITLDEEAQEKFVADLVKVETEAEQPSKPVEENREVPDEQEAPEKEDTSPALSSVKH